MGWLLWLAASSAFGGKLGRAERGLEELSSGDEDHLSRTLESIEAATQKGAADDPFAWVLRGRIYQALLGRTDLEKAPAETALESYEKAVAMALPERASGSYDALEVGRLSEQVPALEASLVAELVNLVEGKDWGQAERVLVLASRARTLDEHLRGPTPERKAQLQRLAVQVAVNLGRPADAGAHYAEYLDAAKADDIGLACVVARAFVEQGKFEPASAFLAPLSERHPADEVLLRTEVDLLLQSGLKTQAEARIERVWSTLSESVSGAFLAAQLYGSVGRTDQARIALERVLELDPRHVDAEIALGRLLTGFAVARRAELQARAEEFEQRKPSREVLTQLRAVTQLWSEAERRLVSAREHDPASKEALLAYVALYEAKIAGFDEEAATRTELAALATDRQKLEAANAALALLGGK